MFKMKNLLLIITGLGLLFSSCTKEEVNVVDSELEASFRTYINGTGTRASGTNWDVDDEIGIYALNQGQTLSASAIYDGKANIQYKNSIAGAAADFSPVGNPIMFPGDGTELDFVAYYPYSATAVSVDYKLAVNISNQSPLSAIDLLYATTTKQSKANPSVALAFSHRMAQVVFTLTSTPDINLDGVTVTLENVLTEGTMNLADGVITAGTVKGTVTPVYDATAKTATAILLPGQQMSDVVVHIALTDGTTYTWSPAAYVLTSNTTNSYILNLTTGEAEVDTDGSTIGDWGEGNDSPSEDLDPNVPAPVEPKVEFTNSNFNAAGGTTTLQITAPKGTEWTASTDATWLTLGTPTIATRSSQNFTGSADIEVTAAENTTTDERTGTVTVTIGTETLTATITQAAAEGGTPGDNFATDLFISEYIEGSSNNKAIEIYNGTGKVVDLSIYSIKKQSNGAGDYANNLPLTGTLAHGEVYILAHSSSVATILNLANLTKNSSPLDFNGNDAVGLFKNDTQIDEIGVFNQVANWGTDVTLRRLSAIRSPKVPYNAEDWEVLAKDTFDGLGLHTME